MKKHIIAVVLSMAVGLALSAEQVQTNPKARVTKEEVAKGKVLIGKSDCFACHKEKDKLVGPSYWEIAKRYPLTVANITLLAGKIIKGGSGAWGQIPMAPHPAITEVESKHMVTYILSVAGEKE